MTTPVIIDTDPGVDDAMAIYLALRSAELEVLGLTTVFGNHSTDNTTRNALSLLHAVGRDDLPVVQGARRPLVRAFRGPAEHVHGPDGLGGAHLAPGPRRPLAGWRAAEWIIEAVLSRPGEILLLPLGPLTNLALALSLEPSIAGAAREVVLMGGAALVPGNASPTAEANIWNDPEAARAVFEAGWKVTMVGLDVTHQVIMDPDFLGGLGEAGTAEAEVLGRITPFYQGFYREAHGLEGIYVHDPTAVGYVIDPSLFQAVEYPLRVDTCEVAAGNTIVDTRGQWPDAPRVNVLTGVETKRLLDMIWERLTGRQEW